ncbi:aminotransferase class V-fold PLP-dependent enzyme [Streptomyces sp. 71268]|uniref:kynureninase n=1 Tax=Streptomyces sp. 71268 TaxID=3002640 RepID=UPI0023F70E10|nr:aminotransferase class V-fold PLP-dependent enzyme [Streptomyces sp. 71268]WEV26287.1 aminotransferase class V-fold PLP-dependent enzyme [Streptomyces sp. 71268]
MSEHSRTETVPPGATPATAGAAAPAAGTATAVGRAHAAEAARRDREDPLAGTRERFVVDAVDDPDGTVYLDGNSLGALPRGVPARMADVIEREWGRDRINSWSDNHWWTAPERIGDRVGALVGAAPGQIVVGDSTSVNVLKAVVAGVRLARGAEGGEQAGAGATDAGATAGGRDEILVDVSTFPTDGYIAESAARLTGCALRAVPADAIASEATPRTALALVNHVDYRTGRLHDLPGTTAALHAAGAVAVWDLCHSAGALPVDLDAHGVDLAVGCTYKYLNGGPGAPAYLYVAARHQPRFDSPLPGWNSHADPFAMAGAYAPADGAVRGRVGTPDILSMLALESALDAWQGVSIESVRAKSLALGDFFLTCVAAYVPAGAVETLTPVAHAERGSQVALRCADAGEVTERLLARGVVIDYRRPDVLRFGFTPLYTGYADVERAAWALGEVLSAA